MCRPAKIPAMTRGRGSKMGQGCRRRGVWMRCGGLRCGSAAPMAHCIAYCAKASQRKHWEPHPIDRSTDRHRPSISARLHSPATQPLYLQQASTRPRTQGNERDLLLSRTTSDKAVIFSFFHRLAFLIVAHTKALVLTPLRVEQQADTRSSYY